MSIIEPVLVARVRPKPWKLCSRDDAIQRCKEEGFAEIIYLDAVEHRFVEEVVLLISSVSRTMSFTHRN